MLDLHLREIDRTEVANVDHVAKDSPRTGAFDLVDQRTFNRLPRAIRVSKVLWDLIVTPQDFQPADWDVRANAYAAC